MGRGARKPKQVGSCGVYVIVDRGDGCPLLLCHRRSRHVTDSGTIAAPGGIVERVLCPCTPAGSIDFEAGARATAVKELLEETGVRLDDKTASKFLLLPVDKAEAWYGHEKHRNFCLVFANFPRVTGPEVTSVHEVQKDGLMGIGHPAGDGYHAWVDVRQLLSRGDLMRSCRVPLEGFLQLGVAEAGPGDDSGGRPPQCAEAAAPLARMRGSAATVGYEGHVGIYVDDRGGDVLDDKSDDARPGMPSAKNVQGHLGVYVHARGGNVPGDKSEDAQLPGMPSTKSVQGHLGVYVHARGGNVPGDKSDDAQLARMPSAKRVQGLGGGCGLGRDASDDAGDSGQSEDDPHTNGKGSNRPRVVPPPTKRARGSLFAPAMAGASARARRAAVAEGLAASTPEDEEELVAPPVRMPEVNLDRWTVLPRVAVFDLDDTCWKGSLDTKPFKGPPFSWCPMRGTVVDVGNTPVPIFPDVPRILLALYGRGVRLAVASHNTRRAWCCEVMDKLVLDQDTGLTWGMVVPEALRVITCRNTHWPAKDAHLKDISESLPEGSCDFREMILFDDGKKICQKARNLDAVAVRCPEGLMEAHLHEALETISQRGDL